MELMSSDIITTTVHPQTPRSSRSSFERGTPRRRFTESRKGFVFEKEVQEVFGKGAPKLLPNCRFGPFSSRRVGDSHEIDVFAYMIDNEKERCVLREGFTFPALDNGLPKMNRRTKFPSGTFCTVEVPKELISEAAFVKNQISHAPYNSIFLQGLPLDSLQRVLVQINGFVIKDYDTAIKVLKRSGEHLKLTFFEPNIVDTDSISGALLVLKRNNSHKVFAKAIKVLLNCVLNITNNPKNEKYHRVRMTNGQFPVLTGSEGRSSRPSAAKGMVGMVNKVTSSSKKWIHSKKKKPRKKKRDGPKEMPSDASSLGNLSGGHDCMLAVGFVAEIKSGENVYQFSEDKLEILKQAKETIVAALKIINRDQALIKDDSKNFRKVAREIQNIRNARFEYPQPGVCSLIKKHSPNAKTTRLGEEILVSEEHDAYKVVIGEVYSGDSPLVVQEKVHQLERNVRGYCDRCGHFSRSINVDDDAFDVTSIVGLAVLHLNGCGLPRKQALRQYKKYVGGALSQSATPFLWRLWYSERFVIHVVASEEAALTYEIMSIHQKLQELYQKLEEMNQSISSSIRMLNIWMVMTSLLMMILMILSFYFFNKLEFLATKLELLETILTNS